MNHHGDFRFSGADEFNPTFTFSSSTATSNSTSHIRSKPRLAKLRKPKSSSLSQQQGEADLAYNPFIARSVTEEGSVDCSQNGGKVFDKFRFPRFNAADEVLLTDELQKLKVDDECVQNVASGNVFTCGNLSSCFEFKSRKSGESHDPDSGIMGSSAVLFSDLPRKLDFEDSATCIEGSGKISVQDRIVDSCTGAAREPCNSGAPTSTPSDTDICDQHKTKLTQETFFFTGNYDGGMSPNISSSLNTKVKLGSKGHSGKQAYLKKKRDTVKLNNESRVDPTSCGKETYTKEFCSQLESPQPYSPMDMSPNIVNVCPITSAETFTQGVKLESSERHKKDMNHPPDKDSSYAAQQVIFDMNVTGTHSGDPHGFALRGVRKSPLKDFASESETESFKSAAEALEFSTDNVTSTARNNCMSCDPPNKETINLCSDCKSEDTSGTKFTFTASSSVKPTSMRHFKKVNRSKGSDSYKSTASRKVSNSVSSDDGKDLKGLFQDAEESNLSCSQLKSDMNTSTAVTQKVNHEPSGMPATNKVAQEACEKWRLRGNQAYESGDLLKAEECYTRGIRCIPKSEKSRGCPRSLMLCYSNRAATRMSLGRLREAVKDCKVAAGIDPSFFKAYVRAANCYLALGELEEASKFFNHCLQPGTGVSADKKILNEASMGLHKVQRAAKSMSHSIESIQLGSCNDAENALRSADEALAICLYSEKLLEIKAEALFVLQEYSKVIQVCQESFDSAERNSKTTGVNGQNENPNSSSLHTRHNFRLWRCRLMLKSHFFLGKPEEALVLLEKHELSRESETLESLIPLVAVIRELLRLKAAGNEAFQSGKYAEAIEHYTAALALNIDSNPFAAVCFCNRAAAYKAQGKVIDAIADCNLAIALERDYLKAILRRASLYELIRDYGQAAKDTELIVSILRDQADISLQNPQEKSINSGIPVDLRQARLQLSRLKEQAKKDTPLNLYLILDVKSSAPAADIKKAYRQAALKHHPDKAGQLLAKADSRRNVKWKEITEDVHRDADRLFKLIGEAYTVLSDPAQRSGYDAEEETRNVLKKNREPFTSRTHFDTNYYPFHRKSRKSSNNFWKSYGYY